MHVDDEFIRELTQMVWTTVVGLEAYERAPGTDEVEEITTSVDISGAWEGTVSLTLTTALGKHVAATMLACPEAETSQELMQDVLRELANMIGGNVKGLIPGQCKLSLPRVEPESSGKGKVLAKRMWFDCNGLPFRVTVRERDAANEPS